MSSYTNINYADTVYNDIDIRIARGHFDVSGLKRPINIQIEVNAIWGIQPDYDRYIYQIESGNIIAGIRKSNLELVVMEDYINEKDAKKFFRLLDISTVRESKLKELFNE